MLPIALKLRIEMIIVTKIPGGDAPGPPYIFRALRALIFASHLPQTGTTAALPAWLAGTLKS